MRSLWVWRNSETFGDSEYFASLREPDSYYDEYGVPMFVGDIESRVEICPQQAAELLGYPLNEGEMVEVRFKVRKTIWKAT